MLRKETIIEEDNPVTMAFEDTEELNNKNLYFQIVKNIEKYMTYITLNNQVAVSAISPNGAVQLNQNVGYNTFLAKKMYSIDKIDNITVFVNGIARNYKTEEDYYLVVNIDYRNNTFEVIASSKEEFENAVNNSVQEKYKKDIFVESNQYNSFQQEIVSDFEILKIYFEDYKFKALYQPEEAFSFIDPEYKKAKFNNEIEAFQQYIQNNVNRFQDANIVKHGVTQENEYTKYVFVDNYNNYYELKETGINQYTIILDNYTLESDEQTKTYNRLTDEQKALSNMDKIMKLINQKDYSTVYGYLNEDFKNTNFPTLEGFTKYMQETFFDNNIVGSIGIKKEGNIYLLSVPYKESLSRAAEDMEKTFVMKLTDGLNFEISFEK